MSRQQVYAAAERGRYHPIHVRPIDAALGAEIDCGDLTRISDEDFAVIRKAWLNEGGKTGFCNMDRALATLPPQLRAKLTGRSVKHDAT